MLISIREDDARPIYAQIVAEIKGQIRDGLLRPGEELPGVRELAEALGVNLHTVHKAYQVLRDQGVIHLRLGQRAKVAQVPTMPAGKDALAEMRGQLDELITEAFHKGVSKEQFRRLVEELLNETKERGQ